MSSDRSDSSCFALQCDRNLALIVSGEAYMPGLGQQGQNIVSFTRTYIQLKVAPKHVFHAVTWQPHPPCQAPAHTG